MAYAILVLGDYTVYKLLFALVFVAFAVFSSGCGTPPAAVESSSDAECAQINNCTGADVPGYSCQPIRHNKSFRGYRCIISYEDFQTSPNCLEQSGGTCGSWGGPVQNCCPSVQGPGSPFAP